MKWFFSSEFTIEDVETGFVIYLLSGYWSAPQNIIPKVLICS